MGLHQSSSSINQLENKIVEDRKLILYGLFKIFHLFVIDMCYLNNGNPNIICSILRDYSWNWSQFHKKLGCYLDPFSKRLEGSGDLKVTIEDGKSDDTYTIKIEVPRLKTAIENETGRASFVKIPPVIGRKRLEESVQNPLRKLKNPVLISWNILLIRSKFYAGIFNYLSKKPIHTFEGVQTRSQYLKSIFEQSKETYFDQILALRLFLISRLWMNDLPEIRSIDLVNILNHCLRCDHPLKRYVRCDDLENVKIEIENEEMQIQNTEKTYFSHLLDSLKLPDKIEENKVKEELEDEQVESLQKDVNEALYNVDKCSKTFNELKEELACSTVERISHPEEFADEENESNENFKKDLQELIDKQKEELEMKREERRKRNMEHEKEMKNLRRQQKQSFAALMKCIFLNQRFKEKESEWSMWIENCYRKLIVTMIQQFTYFQDMTRSPTYFEKLLKESPKDVNFEIQFLIKEVSNLLYDSNDVFDYLAKIDQVFDSVLFIRVLQKSICDISSALIDVLDMLEVIHYSSEWYQKLDTMLPGIKSSDVPTVNDLKRICKNVSPGEYDNLKFPKWERRCYTEVQEEDKENEESGTEDQKHETNESLSDDEDFADTKHSEDVEVILKQEVQAEEAEDKKSETSSVKFQEDRTSESILGAKGNVDTTYLYDDQNGEVYSEDVEIILKHEGSEEEDECEESVAECMGNEIRENVTSDDKIVDTRCLYEDQNGKVHGEDVEVSLTHEGNEEEDEEYKESFAEVQGEEAQQSVSGDKEFVETRYLIEDRNRGVQSENFEIWFKQKTNEGGTSEETSGGGLKRDKSREIEPCSQDQSVFEPTPHLGSKDEQRPSDLTENTQEDVNESIKTLIYGNNDQDESVTKSTQKLEKSDVYISQTKDEDDLNGFIPPELKYKTDACHQNDEQPDDFPDRAGSVSPDLNDSLKDEKDTPTTSNSLPVSIDRRESIGSLKSSTNSERDEQTTRKAKKQRSKSTVLLFSTSAPYEKSVSHRGRQKLNN